MSIYCPHCMQKMDATDQCCPMCGHGLDVHNDSTQLPVGALIAGDGHTYSLGEALGCDGVGHTYIARDLEVGSVVVVQEYYPSNADLSRESDGLVNCSNETYDAFEGGRKGFLEEGQLLVRLTSGSNTLPSVARILACFTERGTAYRVMERVEGITLEKLMEMQTSCEPTMFLQRAMPLARDIDRLHELGLVHGGISPRHVIWTSENKLRLVGFGARWGGFPNPEDAYVAPEQCSSSCDASAWTPATDVYSLSATLYFGLAGMRPSSAFERMRARRNGEADPFISISKRGAIVPDVVGRVITNGLSLDSAARPQSIKEFISPLEELLAQMEHQRKELEREDISSGRGRCIWCMAPMKGMRTCPVCGRVMGSYRAPAHHLPPGTMLGARYLLGASIGEGAFGITYIGFDCTLKREVAIKEYYPASIAMRGTSDAHAVVEMRGIPTGSIERGRARFLEEARALARLGAGSAAAVALDFFEENNTAYIVMEYVKGESLREYLHRRENAMPMRELINLLRPVFEVLSELHGAQLVHRDVSPDNIVVGESVARLVDFGLACGFAETDEPFLGNAILVGLRHGYAPPEQYAGGGFGPWTDVYALCATMYYCLTGKEPPHALDRVAGDCLVVPSELGANVSVKCEAVLAKGLSLKTSERYQTIPSLQEELEKALDDGERSCDRQLRGMARVIKLVKSHLAAT